LILPKRIVLDASVAIQLVVLEEHSDLVAAILAPHRHELIAPDLLYVECAGILWKKSRKNGLAHEDCKGRIETIRCREVKQFSCRSLSVSALGIAMECGISVYDASYVAAASLVQAPLITADLRLVHCMTNAPYSVVALRDVQC